MILSGETDKDAVTDRHQAPHEVRSHFVCTDNATINANDELTR
jgi:hypothetical protein